MIRQLLWAVAVVATCLLPVRGWAAAANWAINGNTKSGRASISAKGDTATWSEPSTNDSGVLCTHVPAMCDNTGSTDFTVYRADPTGSKLHIWNGPIADGVSCAGVTTCGSVELDPGCYVFDIDGAGSGASAACYGIDQSGGGN